MFKTSYLPTPRAALFATVLLVILLAAGCTADGEDSRSNSGTPTPSPATARLPVSLNEVMVALVNQAADPIWVAAWHEPTTDKDWRELERIALQLEIAGALLPLPGTGPLDEQWAQDPTWRGWADELRRAGGQALEAVERRDSTAITVAGDRIVEVCEGCHMDFKPDLPTGGKFGELSPTEDSLDQ